MLSDPEKKVKRIVFLFSTKFKMADESHVTLKSLNCFTDLSKEATYPGHMLIRFWCDSDITFSRGLHTNLVTVLLLMYYVGRVGMQALPPRQI